MTEADEIRRIHHALGIPADYRERTGLAQQSTPDDLVDIGLDMFGRPQRLRRAAAAAWLQMQARAQAEGVVVQVVSAYRSLDYQVGLIRDKLEAGEDILDILTRVAAPGFSEHQSGCALDLGCPDCDPVTDAFEGTPAHQWLTRFATEFDFHLSYPRDNPHGVVYEPWHWCFESR